MRKTLTAALVIAAVATSGCSLFKTRTAAAPDEFAVARNAPLIIPPDFSLTPPVAGTAGLSAGDAQQQAIDALFGGPAPRSATETSALNRAGTADPGIRSAVGSPTTLTVDKGTTTQAILAAPEGDGQVASAAIPS